MGVADSSGRESGRPGKLFCGEIFRNPEGRFPFLTSFCRNSGPKFAKGDKLWNALVIAGAKHHWIGKSGIAP